MNETPEQLREPAWLTHMVDQRIALMEDATGGNIPSGTLVMTPLTEPEDGASQEAIDLWERTCDRCGTYCPGSFYTGQCMRILSQGQRCVITFGVCPKCKEEE